MANLISLLGLLVILGIGILFSTDRKAIRWRTIGWGIGLQMLLALFILRTDLGKGIFQALGDGVTKLLSYTREGSSFVFGKLVSDVPNMGYIFAFQVFADFLGECRNPALYFVFSDIYRKLPVDKSYLIHG